MLRMPVFVSAFTEHDARLRALAGLLRWRLSAMGGGAATKVSVADAAAQARWRLQVAACSEPERVLAATVGVSSSRGGCVVLGVALASTLLFSAHSTQGQSTPDPEQDLTVSFSSDGTSQTPGHVLGAVTNRSDNTYPCVRIEFRLLPRFDAKPGDSSGSVRSLAVIVRDLGPRSVRKYREPLPFPAGIGLGSVRACSETEAESRPSRPEAPQVLSFSVEPRRVRRGEPVMVRWQTANAERVLFGAANPAFPRTAADPILRPEEVPSSGSRQLVPSVTTTYALQAFRGAVSTSRQVEVTVAQPQETSGTCTISGVVTGMLRGRECLDETCKKTRLHTLREVFLFTERPRQQVARARFTLRRVQGKREWSYAFHRVPAGTTYEVRPPPLWFMPGGRAIACQPNGSHVFNVHITTFAPDE